MNQVAEKKEGALQTNLFEADAQQGAQNISQEDLALPFLKILGQLSPEVNKRDGKYCLLYTSPSPRDVEESRMPSSA